MFLDFGVAVLIQIDLWLKKKNLCLNFLGRKKFENLNSVLSSFKMTNNVVIKTKIYFHVLFSDKGNMTH